MQEITVTLTIEEAQAVLNALALRPYQEVVGIINKVVGQVKAQQQQGLHAVPKGEKTK